MKLFVTDLDGTLLDDDKNIPEKNKQAIQEAVKKGHHFAIATGRSVGSAKKILRKLDVEGYILALNGTYVVKEDLDGNILPLFQGQLKKDWLLPAFQLAVEEELTFLITGPVKSYRVVQKEDTQVMAESSNRSDVFLYTIEEMRNFLIHSNDDFLKIVFYSPNPEKLNQMKVRLKELEIPSIFSDTMYLEILPPNTNKGTSLTFLAEHLNLSIEDTIAFGDQENDLEMLQTAGTSYAMANGIPKVKKIANYVTLSNEESGVGCAIEKLI